MREKALQEKVEAVAAGLGLLTWHDRDSRRNAPGFPDLVIVGRTVLWVELKSDTGTIKPAQLEWCVRLQAAGAMYRLWKPRDWFSGEILQTLTWLAEDIRK